MREVQAIIFDLDDTLWEVGPVIVRAEHAMRDVPRRALPARARAAHARLDARPARAHGARAPRDAPRLHVAAARVAAPPRTRGGLPGGDGRGGLRRVLPRAQRGRRCTRTCCRRSSACTGASGCSRSATAMPTSTAIGLARFFEHALAARDAGMLKPDPRIFDAAARAARASTPAQVLHVGDDAYADVEGARRAGLTPVWVNRAGERRGRWPPSPPPLTVRSLTELAGPARLACRRASPPPRARPIRATASRTRGLIDTGALR